MIHLRGDFKSKIKVNTFLRCDQFGDFQSGGYFCFWIVLLRIGFLENRSQPAILGGDYSTFSNFQNEYLCYSVSNTVVEPYNSLLALDKMAQCENVVILDNESLYRIMNTELMLDSPAFSDLNRIVSHIMAGMTGSIRFNGQINMDLSNEMHILFCKFTPRPPKFENKGSEIRMHLSVVIVFLN